MPWRCREVRERLDRRTRLQTAFAHRGERFVHKFERCFKGIHEVIDLMNMPLERAAEGKFSALCLLRLEGDAFDTRGLEVSGERRGEEHGAIIDRMLEAQFPGMEHLAWIGSPFAIDFVAQEWMAQMLEMNANLVRATGVERAFEKGRRAEISRRLQFREDSPAGAGVASFAGLDHGHLLSVHRMAPDGGLNGSALAGEPARGKSEINLRYLTPRELPAQGLMRQIGLCGDEASARLFIQPVNDAGAQFAADAGKRPAMMKEGIDERATPVSRSRMNDHARRLVDDDERVVLKNYVERDLLGLSPGLTIGGGSRSAMRSPRRSLAPFSAATRST